MAGGKEVAKYLGEDEDIWKQQTADETNDFMHPARISLRLQASIGQKVLTLTLNRSCLTSRDMWLSGGKSKT